MQTKSDIRALAVSHRNALTDDLLNRYSEQIVQNILALPVMQNADAILTYSPVGRELHTEPIAQYALARGIPLFYPKCEKSDCSLRFLQITSQEQLVCGAYGIREPISECADYDDLSFLHPVMIVPGLAFSHDGHRTGYGKGYYDRFLARHIVTTVGAVIHSCFFDTLPYEDTDVPVDTVITEKGAFPVGQSDR